MRGICGDRVIEIVNIMISETANYLNEFMEFWGINWNVVLKMWDRRNKTT